MLFDTRIQNAYMFKKMDNNKMFSCQSYTFSVEKILDTLYDYKLLRRPIRRWLQTYLYSRTCSWKICIFERPSYPTIQKQTIRLLIILDTSVCNGISEIWSLYWWLQYWIIRHGIHFVTVWLINDTTFSVIWTAASSLVMVVLHCILQNIPLGHFPVVSFCDFLACILLFRSCRKDQNG